MDLHRFRTQNVLFIYFSKKVTFYLNIYCNLKYNLMYSCNLSAPIPLAVYLLGSMAPAPSIYFYTTPKYDNTMIGPISTLFSLI